MELECFANELVVGPASRRRRIIALLETNCVGHFSHTQFRAVKAICIFVFRRLYGGEMSTVIKITPSTDLQYTTATDVFGKFTLEDIFSAGYILYE